ncbi:argK family protein [Mycobacterium xenopi 4042]|uniref:ArgK family protein n=1 Tax=Mycobacterium xenopi 4042 TaxID=1299334 RepID=X8AG02_MYCXE|nr:argK family protein [Mycobacterium xenopi 4042]
MLAVDPSSPFSGGALLGDRIRMTRHINDSQVLIRSLATRGHLGGLAAAVPAAIRLLGALGYDVILLETVGVGQSEVEIAAVADPTVVILNPARATRCRPPKPGCSKSPTLWSSTRPTATAPTRPFATCARKPRYPS